MVRKAAQREHRTVKSQWQWQCDCLNFAIPKTEECLLSLADGEKGSTDGTSHSEITVTVPVWLTMFELCSANDREMLSRPGNEKRCDKRKLCGITPTWQPKATESYVIQEKKTWCLNSNGWTKWVFDAPWTTLEDTEDTMSTSHIRSWVVYVEGCQPSPQIATATHNIEEMKNVSWIYNTYLLQWP
jgi:hypothetical protein